MLVRYQRNKKTAYYDSETLATVGRPEPPEPIRGPFLSCGKCPYAAHGFLCYTAEGDCLKTHFEKFQNVKKAEEL